MADAKPEEKRNCANCHHCIDIYWTEKIVCLAFLEVRPLAENGQCPEFTPRQKRPPETSRTGI